MSKDPSALPNTGARSSIQVQSFDVPVGCVAFWVSDDSASNLWMQVGYYICDGSTPVVFTQVWNLASYTVVYANILSSTPTAGIHQFAVYLQSGTTWVATYDGTVVGSYDLGASVSSSSYPVYALTEENGLAAAISIPHPRWEERPLLLCTLAPGHAIESEELLKHMAQSVAKWWLPDEIVFVDRLPLTGTGKIDKKALRQQYAERGSTFSR